MGGGGGGGGSNNSTTESLTQLPDWAVPSVKHALNKAVSLEESGAFNHVQDLTPEQLEASKRRLELGKRGGVFDMIGNDSYGATQAYRDAAQGTGLFGANALGSQVKAMEDSIGKAQSSQLGSLLGTQGMKGQLGSARAQAANAFALSQTAANMAANELNQRRSNSLAGASGVLSSGSTIQNQLLRGADLTGSVGDAFQQQAQNEGDAAYQGIQRLFGLASSPAIGTQTTQTTNTTQNNSGGGK